VIPQALLFGIAGILHFVVPSFFDRIVPPWVPDARLATLVSGACEIAGAVGLLIPRLQAPATYGLMALLVAVFPANVFMLQEAYASGASALWITAMWARLPLQPLLIWWLWRGLRGRERRAR
jgi:uncharacterized membrane protein